MLFTHQGHNTGHKTEGIFRVPGKNSEIARLKTQFNKVGFHLGEQEELLIVRLSSRWTTASLRTTRTILEAASRCGSES